MFAPLNREGNGVVSAYQLNSLGISNSCTFGANSARKVLKAMGIAVHNDRPQRRYSGLLASLRNGGQEGAGPSSPSPSHGREGDGEVRSATTMSRQLGPKGRGDLRTSLRHRNHVARVAPPLVASGRSKEKGGSFIAAGGC